MAKKHIYVTDLEGTGSYYYGTIEWGEHGSISITLEGGYVHFAVGYYINVAVLDITFEELEVLQTRAISMSPAMNMSSTPVKTVTYVYGQDITLMDDRSLMLSIVLAQGEIKSLADTYVVSTKAQSMINDLEAAVSLMVEKLDKDC